ncbi:MAG: hypothetical protein ABSD89_13415, partial [Halobacteriota archaeon]
MANGSGLNPEPVAQESVVDSALLRSNLRPFKTAFLYTSCTQIAGVNPLDGTNYLDTASAFLKAFLHLLAGEGVWGRGRHLSPFP